MDNRKNIDKLFSEKLFENEIVPSDDVWSKIDNQLHPDNKISNKNKSQTFIKYSLIVFLMLIISSAFYFSSQSKSEIQDLTNTDIIIAQNSNGINSSSKEELSPAIINRYEDKFEQSNQTIQTLEKVNEKSNLNVTNETQSELNQNPLDEVIEYAKFDPSLEESYRQVIGINNEIELKLSEVVQENYQGQNIEDHLVIENKIQEPILESNSVSADLSIPIDFIQPYSTQLVPSKKIKQATLKQNSIEEFALYAEPIQLKGMSIGVAASYIQTSILESSNSFVENKPIQQSIKLSPIKGITFGYNFNNAIGIQVDYIYNSVLGQNYILQEGDQVVHKSLSLYYDQIPVVVKFKSAHQFDLTNKPVVANYIAGVQYGILKDYRIPQEKRLSDPISFYKPYDLSLIVGIDYDFYLSNRMFLTVGARTTLSNDISTHELPLDIYAKRNFTFGLRGSLNFMFRDY